MAIAAPGQTSFNRGDPPFKIQLLSEPPPPPGGFWGLESRTADHAVVAMNSAKDIVVAYHTDRNDLDSVLRPKQVEAVLFDYSFNPVTLVETWTYKKTFLLGSTLENPRGIFGITHTKCERPDVIAVGELFFVTWTRIYQHNPVDQDPAVLEGAWIEWDDLTGTHTVYDDAGASSDGSGLGFILDDNYKVLECAGVPDAVILDDGSRAFLPRVAVVYPAQTIFSSGSSLDRTFELRISTCTLDISNTTSPMSSTAAANVLSPTATVSFNGDDGEAAGMILPDLAQGADPDQFVLAFEEQFNNPGPPSQDYGLIRLHRIARINGVWSSQQSHTFGTSQSTLARRRPNLSTYDPVGSGGNTVTIAFNTYLAGHRSDDADVVFSEWILDPELGIFRTGWPSGVGQPTPGWPNDPGAPTLAYDFRPVPLSGHGADFRRCYAETFQAPAPPSGNCSLIEYDLDSNQFNPPLVTAELARPAVAYHYDDANTADPHYIALTWEQNLVTPNKWRIYLLVR